MMRETKVAIAAAKEAGKIAMRYYGKKLEVQIKEDGTPVTIADKLCEKKIISVIRKSFPQHSILSEESGEIKGNEYRWIIDPIDGTKEFIRGQPFFGILIALEKNGAVLSGVILLPALNKILYAEKGGAYMNGKRISVSKTKNLKKSYILCGGLKGFYKTNHWNLLRKLTENAASVRSVSAPYACSIVAFGVADANIEPAVHPWDLAAMKIIIEEAGGRVTDFSGKDTIYSGNAIASNGKLHNKLLKLLRR